MTMHEYLTSEIALEHAEGLLTRREALRRLGLLGVGTAVAVALLDTDALAATKRKTKATRKAGNSRSTATSVATTFASTIATTSTTMTATSTPTTNKATGGEAIVFAGPAGKLFGAYAAPAGKPKGAVLVIHENRGLTDHFKALPSRFAKDGYAAVAIDLASRAGGTDKVASQMPAPLSQASTEDLVADMRAGFDELGRRAPGAKIGAIGFCFGGGMVWNLINAADRRLAAAAPFYGVGPSQPNFAPAKSTAVLAVYAELDARVNANRDAMTAAMKDGGLTYEVKTFPGVDHAFFNDTGPRYDAAQATLAYQAVLAWFGKYLAN